MRQEMGWGIRIAEQERVLGSDFGARRDVLIVVDERAIYNFIILTF